MKTRMLNSLLRHRSASIAALAMAAAVTVANANPIPLPVVNGDFETTSITGSYQFGTGYQSGGSPVDTVTGWDTSGYNFIFASGTADTTGSTGHDGNLTLWGPNNGGAASNHLPAASPLGGNYVAADGAYEVAAITQTISGLVVGQQYSLPFYYAGAQQESFTGATTELWTVSLGAESYSTPLLNNVNHGFTGWKYADFTFTATSSSEVLSFLAVGTPTGKPPFSLLDGVGLATPLSTTPEPSSFAFLFTGMAGAAGFVRSRFKKVNV